jgi:pimeloyl-ACP methyl ester carboxylesterase
MSNDQDIKSEGSAATGSATYVHRTLTSSFDGSEQPIRYWKAPGVGRPAMVYLHSWSTDYLMDPGAWFGECVQRGWHFIMPNFRGPNNKPEACASEAARADVLDAATFALDELGCDPTRLYLAGGSGGAHMTLVMAGYHPDRFSAASSWCGLSDVAGFYHHHNINNNPTRYAKMVIACMGGAPGESAAADAEYRARSPKYNLENARELPIDFSHGVRDGKPAGLVPGRQTIDGFNVLARAFGVPEVTEKEIQELWVDEKLSNPKPGDTDPDPEYQGRAIYLRRFAGPSRLTMFDGGHHAVAFAGCQWLGRFARPVKR